MKSITTAFEVMELDLKSKGFRFERTDFNRPWGGFFVIEESQAPLFIETYYPEEDAAALRAKGVARVYTPKDFELNVIMSDIVELVSATSEAAA